MINRLIQILKNNPEITGWKIIDKKRESHELYYIRRELEMNRAKDLRNIDVTVYKDFQEGEKIFKGSSMTRLHPSMTDDEMVVLIDEAAYATQFAKSPFYPLVEPTGEILGNIETNLAKKPLNEFLPEIVEAIFSVDQYENGYINSTEIFLSKISTRILNSLGLDYTFDKYQGEVEFITTWKEHQEEIELYHRIDFANFVKEEITNEVKDALETSKGRAIANPTPSLGTIDVLISKVNAAELLRFYLDQASALFAYEGFSAYKIGDSVQGDEIIGDKINLSLNPFLPNSTFSSPIDQDGIVLNIVDVIENGKVKTFWGDQKNAHYLGIKPSGTIQNLMIQAGSKAIEELKSKPYLEVFNFSSFQVDNFTGDFGGEIRFGWYYDGEKSIPIYGGSISGNLRQLQKEMYFSKEMISINRYEGPKYVQIKNVSVAGNI